MFAYFAVRALVGGATVRMDRSGFSVRFAPWPHQRFEYELADIHAFSVDPTEEGSHRIAWAEELAAELNELLERVRRDTTGLRIEAPRGRIAEGAPAGEDDTGGENVCEHVETAPGPVAGRGR